MEYLAIGHVTRDLLPDGGAIPGGSVLYAATTAQRLGLQAAIYTVTAEADLPLLPMQIHAVASDVTTTFENRYGPLGRTQLLHACAAPVTLADLPSAWRAAPLVHLAPVVHECDLALLAAFPQARVLATPQGWLRAWDAGLPSAIRRRLWRPAPALLGQFAALVLSIEDVAGDESLPQSYAADCSLVIVTRGAAGATAYLHGQAHQIPALAAIERDPTGAGDVFAAALLAELHTGADPLAAAHFAAATAACAIEALGMAGIPDREQVLRRMEH